MSNTVVRENAISHYDVCRENIYLNSCETIAKHVKVHFTALEFGKSSQKSQEKKGKTKLVFNSVRVGTWFLRDDERLARTTPIVNCNQKYKEKTQ